MNWRDSDLYSSWILSSPSLWTRAIRHAFKRYLKNYSYWLQKDIPTCIHSLVLRQKWSKLTCNLNTLKIWESSWISLELSRLPAMAFCSSSFSSSISPYSLPLLLPLSPIEEQNFFHDCFLWYLCPFWLGSLHCISLERLNNRELVSVCSRPYDNLLVNLRSFCYKVTTLREEDKTVSVICYIDLG